MKLILRKSDWLEDWYVIERAEHDGKEWFTPIGHNATAYCCSSRLGNADVEGTAEHMLAIAEAIEKRASVGFKRCAVEFDGDCVFFYSPRNSTDRGPAVPVADADALAVEIRRTLGTKDAQP